MNTLTIGERIKALRQEQNYSVDEMAKRAKISRATYYRYESADAENLPIKTIKIIAKALNTTPEYILGLTDDKRTKEWSMIETYNENLKLRHEASVMLQQEIYGLILANTTNAPYVQLLNLLKFISMKQPEYLEGMFLILGLISKESQQYYTTYDRNIRELDNVIEGIKIFIASMEASALSESQSVALEFLKNSLTHLFEVKQELDIMVKHEKDRYAATEHTRNEMQKTRQAYINNTANG